MLDTLLACPRCDNALTPAADGYACGGCKVEFPMLDGIPFLFAEPAAALGDWRARLHMELERIERERTTLAAALDARELRESTRLRLERLAAAQRDHATRLGALLEPLELARCSAKIETYLALRTRLPADQGLNTYYPNMHRDWCWGERENEAALELVTDMLDPPLGRVLVLGAGAGRLAYDLHRRFAPDLTIALDFNPLFMLLARRLARGESLDLYEFPFAPITPDDQARLRRLAAPEAVDGMEFIIADASRPPFCHGSFNTIVTPWVTDILPEDLAHQAARINHLLTAGGQWVNFGSIAFDSPDPARRYGIDEFVDIVREQGFDHPHIDETRIPYMCSPASRHGRQELVATIAAQKTGKATPAPRWEALPDWLVRGDAPVPLTRSFQLQSASTRIHAFVMSMIDGKRSIRDMAQLMEEQRLMTRAEAVPTIRSFLIRMLDDANRGA